jgi:hypothetical protein
MDYYHHDINYHDMLESINSIRYAKRREKNA